MTENLLEMSKWTEDLCLRKYFGPRGLSAPAPGLYNIFSETARPIKAKLFSGASLGRGNESLYKRSRSHDQARSHDQDGRDGYK